MKPLLLSLQSIPLFSNLPESCLRTVGHLFTAQQFTHGTPIVQQGGKSNTLFVLESGRANVTFANKDGEQIILAHLGSGECIGEMHLIDGEPHSASVYACGVVSTLSLRRTDFARCLVEHPSIAAHVRQTLARRLRRANNKVQSLATLDAAGRLAHVLLELSVPQGTNRVLKNRFSQRDLAQMTGLSAQAVNYALRHLREQGLVIQRGDMTVLVNRPSPKTSM
ncbi:MAG: Crp/Fnr family transcriptional regulator [Acidobacteriaceae bacterium]